MIAIYSDGWARVVVSEYRIEVQSGPSALWNYYTALPGDDETRRMMALCAANRLPPAILADRIDEVEPPDPESRFAGFTAVLRLPGLELVG